MPFTLTVDLPNIGDQVIYIHGLGSFGNGSHSITDEQAAEYRQINAKNVIGETDKDGSYSVTPVLGLPLEEAVESMYGVTLEVQKPPPPPNPKLDSQTGANKGTDSSGGE